LCLNHVQTQAGKFNVKQICCGFVVQVTHSPDYRLAGDGGNLHISDGRLTSGMKKGRDDVALTPRISWQINNLRG
jgi:hypothetical protein